MKKWIFAVVLGLGSASVNAFADYKQLAECTGRSDKAASVRVTLFVNQESDTQGIVVAAIDKVGFFIDDTVVNWEDNAQGFPRFHDNDFDLDIVIDDKKISTDDILVNGHYVGALTCKYTP